GADRRRPRRLRADPHPGPTGRRAGGAPDPAPPAGEGGGAARGQQRSPHRGMRPRAGVGRGALDGSRRRSRPPRRPPRLGPGRRAADAGRGPLRPVAARPGRPPGRRRDARLDERRDGRSPAGGGMSVATRFVTLWCPEWPVVAARLAPDEPAVVLRAERVTARNPAAIRAGIRPGERRRTAQQACPRLVLVDHDPDRDGREFEPVVRAVAELAPRLEVVEPGLLCLPARGPSRYFGGEQAAAELLVTTVPEA